MAIVSVYYMYVYMPNYYNITSFISESIVFVTVFYWSRITQQFDNSFSNNVNEIPSFFRILKIVFIVCVLTMIYKFISSLGFLWNIVLGFDFQEYAYFIVFTIIDGVLVSVYSYYLLWIFKTEKLIVSLSKGKYKQSFIIK